MPSPRRILTINSGSSSLKFSLSNMGPAEDLLFSGAIERIGLRPSRVRARDSSGGILIDRHLDLPDQEAALRRLFDWLRDLGPAYEPDAVGHRLVYGGPHYVKPQMVIPEVVEALERLVPFAPEHLPRELSAIRAVSRAYQALPQVACFDTAFHWSMPRVAKSYPLPRTFWEEGLRRYGFHGLSYEYVVGELAREGGTGTAEGRAIIAHLGNGASMAAVKGGKSVETTMGLTPAGGLMMGTRSGDLDPGVLLYLLEAKGLSPSNLKEVVNRQAGLLGISGISSDMQDLLGRETKEPPAAEAIELFCYQAKKFLGALAAILGGLETLVFTAGIGEHAPSVRRRICEGMEFLGIRLDEPRNQANASVISPPEGAVTVRVIKTNEELMIARQTHDLLSSRRE